MFVEIVAAILIAPFVFRFLRGCVLGLIIVIAAACAGYYGPLALLIAMVAIVVWIVRRVARLDAPVRHTSEHAAGYSFDAPNLRAVYGDRLDRTRRWSTR